jgi:quercetin 2,3-dioxygenase
MILAARREYYFMNKANVAARSIARVWAVVPQKQHANHTVAMVIDPTKSSEFDPFLLLAEDWFGQGTFDTHPHRGQETVTYVIDGQLQHYDNNAGNGELGPGDVQWMTAGRGVIHKEDPAPGETVHSLQLWINLPKDEKMASPRYQNLRKENMPVRQEDGVFVRVFSGNSGAVEAPTLNHVPVTMLDLSMEAGKTFRQDLPADYNGFIYVLEGSGKFGEEKVEVTSGQAMLLGRVGREFEVSEIEIEATSRLRALLYAGRPLHEPIVSYGPFVMNTRQQIIEAIEDYQSGRFGQ